MGPQAAANQERTPTDLQTIEPSRYLFRRFDNNRRAVGEHFGDALHDFGRIVSRAEHGVPAEFCGVLQHKVERFLTCLLAQVGEESDVAANQRLQSRADRAED